MGFFDGIEIGGGFLGGPDSPLLWLLKQHPSSLFIFILSTSPAASYSRSQVAGGEDPFGLPRLDPCLQPHLLPTAHSVDWGDPDKTQPCKSGKKSKTRTLAPKKHNHKNQSRLSYFKKKHKGSNTLVFSVPQGRSFLLKSSSRVEWAIWRVNPAR